MANCFVPVSANHSDSLSLLKTRSRFKDLMVSKINLASSVIPLPFCIVPSPQYPPPSQDGVFRSRKPAFTLQGIVERGGEGRLLSRVTWAHTERGFWGEETWEDRANVRNTLTSHHPTCFWPPSTLTLLDEELQEAPICTALLIRLPKIIFFFFPSHVRDMGSSVLGNSLWFPETLGPELWLRGQTLRSFPPSDSELFLDHLKTSVLPRYIIPPSAHYSFI